MSTFIHGIGASENIDSSGEIVSIAGLDISSLDKDGVFNWEHKADVPAQVVGKILKARKIFSDADCEDDHQLAFWNKVKVPYLYVMGELMDDYSDSAREVAGKFRYDADKKTQNERATMNFSVEGSKISKEGITVSRSIARKITITVLPCNKAAVAEIVAVPQKSKKGEIDELFKTESPVEIEILSLQKGDIWGLLKKEDPSKHASKLGIKPFQKDMAGGQNSATASSALSGVGPTSAGGLLASEEMKKAANLTLVQPKAADHARGNKIGVTNSGKEVFSHGMVGDYGHFDAADHESAFNAHKAVAEKATDPKIGAHHWAKAKLHSARANSLKDKAKRTTVTPKMIAAKPAAQATASPKASTLFDPGLSGKVHKAEDAATDKTTWSGQEARTQTHRRDDIGLNQSGRKPHKSGVQKVPAFTQDGHTQMELKRQKRQPGLAMPKSEMAKAMTAGSGIAAPDRLEGGAALGKEELKKEVASDQMMLKDFASDANSKRDQKVKSLQAQNDAGKLKPVSSEKIAGGMLSHPTKPLKGTKVQKSEMLQRAEAEYASWNKREEFESFMKSRMPHLTKSEIKVVGQTMILQKSIRQEKLLKDFYNPSGGGLMGKSEGPKMKHFRIRAEEPPHPDFHPSGKAHDYTTKNVADAVGMARNHVTDGHKNVRIHGVDKTGKEHDLSHHVHGKK